MCQLGMGGGKATSSRVELTEIQQFKRFRSEASCAIHRPRLPCSLVLDVRKRNVCWSHVTMSSRLFGSMSKSTARFMLSKLAFWHAKMILTMGATGDALLRQGQRYRNDTRTTCSTVYRHFTCCPTCSMHRLTLSPGLLGVPVGQLVAQTFPGWDRQQ
jgi:hypothetical protein